MNALRSLLVTSAVVAAQVAHASPWPIPALLSVGAWEASLDGVTNWVPAALAPNPITQPVALGAPNGGLGQLMWHPDVNGVAPDKVYFRLFFEIDDFYPHPGTYQTWFAADDVAHMWLNGRQVTTYTLDDHMGADGQPIPEYVVLNDYLLYKSGLDPARVGINEMRIEAHDGDAQAVYNRGYSWVFLDSLNVEQWKGQGVAFVNPNLAPTPATAWLVLAASIAMVASRRRQAASSED